MVALADAGLRRDDVLITQLPNVVEYVAVYLACARLGIVVSPVPMQFRRGEIEPLSRLTKARAVLTVLTFKGTEHARLATTLSDGPQVLVLGNQTPPGTRAFVPEPGPTDAARVRELEARRTSMRMTSSRSAGRRELKAFRKACRVLTITGSPAVCVTTTARRFVAAIVC
jgi:acyl-CoA synthetase (AMP-forming)/AMP-acid ligase II